MEIYKLGDDVPGGLTFKHKCDTMEEVAPEGAGDFGGRDDARVEIPELRITEMKQGVKNPNRVNVFINGKFSFSLDIAQVVEFKLKVGRGISEEELAELRKASEFGKLYQRALEWALARPRSEREMRDYLYRKLRRPPSDPLLRAHRYGAQSLLALPVGRADSSEGTAEFASTQIVARRSSEDINELSNNIISRLRERGYLDDRRFAEFWVENRFVKKGVSAKRLKLELSQKGVAKEIIEEVLNESGRDDAEEIRKMIARKRARYDDEKLIAYLCRQGFSYDLVRELVKISSED